MITVKNSLLYAADTKKGTATTVPLRIINPQPQKKGRCMMRGCNPCPSR